MPPTATTCGEEAGYTAAGRLPGFSFSSQLRYPLSPAEAVMTMPGWLKAGLSTVGSSPVEPNELEISVAPSLAAVSSASSRLRKEEFVASEQDLAVLTDRMGGLDVG